MKKKPKCFGSFDKIGFFIRNTRCIDCDLRRKCVLKCIDSKYQVVFGTGGMNIRKKDAR